VQGFVVVSSGMFDLLGGRLAQHVIKNFLVKTIRRVEVDVIARGNAVRFKRSVGIVNQIEIEKLRKRLYISKSARSWIKLTVVFGTKFFNNPTINRPFSKFRINVERFGAILDQLRLSDVSAVVFTEVVLGECVHKQAW
jgi:hypothetical protein